MTGSHGDLFFELFSRGQCVGMGNCRQVLYFVHLQSATDDFGSYIHGPTLAQLYTVVLFGSLRATLFVPVQVQILSVFKGRKQPNPCVSRPCCAISASRSSGIRKEQDRRKGALCNRIVPLQLLQFLPPEARSRNETLLQQVRLMYCAMLNTARCNKGRNEPY